MLKPINSVGKLLLAFAIAGTAGFAQTIEARPLPASAQPADGSVTGNIKDEFGDPMIGASIQVMGTNKGAATDIDGNFSIPGVAKGAKLKITAVGYNPIEVTWDGTPIDIQLGLNTQQLDEVVVTAMGITREAKTLTYAAQTIKNDEVTRIKETNFINSLKGKSAGLTITPNNSGAGGGASKITLRGQTSILGTNQPLIVLDGVPMSDGMGAQASGESLEYGGGRSGDDLLSTINPEDIENMTILKGPNAAALYGSAANNGVIVITTKKGQEGAASINISSSTSIDRIAMYPKVQRIYGLSQTAAGNLEQWAAWGPKIGERSQTVLDANPYLLNGSRNAVSDFFQTGVTLNNGITISGGTELSRSYFSYNNTYQTGVVPNNKFTRNNVMLKESFALFNKKVNLNISLNWIHQKTENAPVVGKALSAVYSLYRTPGDVDMRYFKHHYQHPGTMYDNIVSDPVIGNPKLVGQPVQTWYWYDQYLNNPYWVANMYNDQLKRDRILGNITLDWAVIHNLKLQTRLNVDYVLENGLNEEWAGMNRVGFDYVGGKYYSNNSRSSDIYNDYLATWNDRYNDKFDVNLAAGMSYSRHFDRSTTITTNIDTSGVPNAFVPQNSRYYRPTNPNGSATGASDSWDYTNWSTAIFGTASVGLYDMIYLDGSYRVEWAQAFQQFTGDKGWKSFDYWSAGFNVLLDKIIPRQDWLDQLKVRGSYSVVGNPIPNTLFGRRTINFANGQVSPQPQLFDDPKPETTKSFETGIDAWMFNNKFNIDVTYYNSTLHNQFMNVSTANGESKPVNTGKIRNYGIEVQAGYRWAINRDWYWQSGFNFAWNDNKILETYIPRDADGNPAGVEYTVEMGPKAFHVKYLKGGRYGDIYVNSYDRYKEGDKYKNAAGETKTLAAGDKEIGWIKLNGKEGDYVNAAPKMATGTYDTFVGNTTSPVTLGWNNTISWKNLTLYFLIDGRIGGKVMSLTEPDLDLFGLSDRTANARLNAEKNPDYMFTTDKGEKIALMDLPDGSGRKISVQNYYETVGALPMEDHVYSATSFRMRDISVSYDFPNLFGHSKGLTAQFSVKNAFFLYKDSPVDPDISVTAANGFSGIDSYSLPTLRSYCLTLKLNF